jgi:hypothetical protein
MGLAVPDHLDADQAAQKTVIAIWKRAGVWQAELETEPLQRHQEDG